MPQNNQSPSAIQVIEMPDLGNKYHETYREFVFWFAPSSLVSIFACALIMYLSSQSKDTLLWLMTLPASALFLVWFLISMTVLWTYLQRRYILDSIWEQHIKDRKVARSVVKGNLHLQFQMNETNIGNLNTGQQVVAALEDLPKVTSYGRDLRDFWRRSGERVTEESLEEQISVQLPVKEVFSLPSPEKVPFVLGWDDVDALIDMMLEYGASRRDTAGMPLPSGRAVYSQIWTAVAKAMDGAGLATVRSRTPTRLMSQDPKVIKAVLRGSYPDGILVYPEKTENNPSRDSAQSNI